MLSQRTRYTIRALQYLADRYNQGPIGLTEISETQNIPKKFLTVILSQFGRLGYVSTKRGPDGGYWLAKAPADVRYGDIVRLTRGSVALVPCASRLDYQPCKNCVTEEKCRLRNVMLMVRDETARILDNVTLADLPPVI